MDSFYECVRKDWSSYVTFVIGISKFRQPAESPIRGTSCSFLKLRQEWCSREEEWATLKHLYIHSPELFLRTPVNKMNNIKWRPKTDASAVFMFSFWTHEHTYIAVGQQIFSPAHMSIVSEAFGSASWGYLGYSFEQRQKGLTLKTKKSWNPTLTRDIRSSLRLFWTSTKEHTIAMWHFFFEIFAKRLWCRKRERTRRDIWKMFVYLHYRSRSHTSLWVLLDPILGQQRKNTASRPTAVVFGTWIHPETSCAHSKPFGRQQKGAP
jgi:hypothetical protein